MPGDRRASLEPLLPGSRDETYAAEVTGDSPTPRRGSNASLASIDSMPMNRRGVGELAPEGRDKTAMFIMLGGILLFFPGTIALILLSSPSRLPTYFLPHAPLNALGITCFALGIASVQPPTPPAGVRAARLALHQRILLGVALPAMALGTSAMYYNKVRNGAQHFTTWHAYAGCTTIAWMLLQAAVGGASVWGGGRLLGGGMKAKGFYKYHRISGYALVAFALFTAALAGGYSDWASGRLKLLRFAAYGVGTVLVMIGLAMRVRPEKMRIR